MISSKTVCFPCDLRLIPPANLFAGSLSLDNLERLVVDASHIDQKKRGILDMKEITMPLMRWLTRKELKERYSAEEKPLHLLFY